MSQPFTLISPTKVETALTGFIGAGERTYRGKVYRAAFHAGETARMTSDGARIAWQDCPRSIQQMAVAAAEVLSSAARMAEAA